MQIDLKCGASLELKKDVLDDMELVDMIVDMRDDDPLAVSRVLLKIVGKDNRKVLYDALREEDGRVPLAKTCEAIKEIFAAVGDKGKNS